MLLLQKHGRREIDTTPITNLYAVGECHPEPIHVVLERFAGETDLSDWQFRIYGVNAAKEPVYQDILLHEIHEETICLCWKIDRTFTAFAGVLHLELHALSADTASCLHYRMDDIWIRPSVWGVGLPLTARMQEIYCQMQKLCHDAALLSLHLPQISGTGTWLLYDKNTAEYVDTGISAKGEKGDTGAQGLLGEKGEKGDAGADGFSPTVTVEQTETGAKITATDKNGTTSAEIKNGKDGTGSGSTDLTEVEASISALQTAVAALQETAHTHENKEFLDGLQVYLNKTFSTVTAGYEAADKALSDRVTTLETNMGDIQTALENIVEVSE